MTVLVAAKKDNKIVLASDKQGTAWQFACPFFKQAFRRNMIFAGTGNCRTIQIVQNQFNPLPINEDHTEEAYVFDMANQIRALLSQYDENFLRSMDASFLVVAMEKIYEIDQSYCVIEHEEAAFGGCGAELAMGAYHALADQDLEVRDRVEKVMDVVQTHSLFCGLGTDISEYVIPEDTGQLQEVEVDLDNPDIAQVLEDVVSKLQEEVEDPENYEDLDWEEEKPTKKKKKKKKNK